MSDHSAQCAEVTVHLSVAEEEKGSLEPSSS